jgi:hypothetical protein
MTPGVVMPIIIRIFLTVVFGFLWWWVYNRVGAGLAYLMILGSVLAVCVCCCHPGRATDGVWAPGQWSYQGYIACLRRCALSTLTLMVSLFVLAVLVIWSVTGAAPTAAEWTNILLAAIGAPLFVRLICCAYE